MIPRFSMLIIGFMAGAALVAGIIFAAHSANANGLAAKAPATLVEPAAPLAVSQVLHYQGRLLTPGAGEPKPDGAYPMVFSIYNVATGGAPLWTESKSVTTSNGAFSTLLGDATPLPLNIFNGQELFLGLAVGGDPEATPRQRMAHSAYAIRAESAAAADTAANAANAGTLDSLDSTAFAAANHNHSGAAITTGTVAEARIDAALTRDSEVRGLVLGIDGAGSTLDADLLDGQNSTAFAAATHNHDGAAITTGTVAAARVDGAITRDSEVMGIVLGGDGAGSTLDADLLDGLQASAFAASSHTHTGAQIVDGSIGSADIADNTITDVDIQNVVRTIGFPANALNYLPGGVITPIASGLQWQSNFSGAAFLNIPRPPDWDGTSNVDMNIDFVTTTNTPGNVQFFIRPRAFDPGDTFIDVSSMTGAPVAVSANNQVGRQLISIPASRFGTKSIWVISMQREGAQETYVDDLIVLSVSLNYTATR